MIQVPVQPRTKADTTHRSGTTDGTSVVRLQKEVAKLSRGRRAHEEAMSRLAAAVIKLRRANGALTEENALLRLEVERVRAQAATPQAAPEASGLTRPRRAG